VFMPVIPPAFVIRWFYGSPASRVHDFRGSDLILDGARVASARRVRTLFT
jgi:hypothetical protein